MKNQIAVLAIVLSGLVSGVASAQNANSSSEGASFKIGPFECMSFDAFADYTTGSKEVRVNNFSISDVQSYVDKELTVLEVAYSIANRRSVEVQLDGQFFLLEARDGGATAVMTASTVSYVAAPGTTETAKGGTFVPEGTLKRAKHICLQIVGGLYD